MWVLRGTETGFAVVSRFKFRARPFPENGKLWEHCNVLGLIAPRNHDIKSVRGLNCTLRRSDQSESLTAAVVKPSSTTFAVHNGNTDSYIFVLVSRRLKE